MSLAIDHQAVIRAVRETRGIILNEERQHQVKKKGVGDFVTQVDLAVQKYLKGFLLERYPQIQFMCEEQDNSHLDRQQPMWLLDPIDGTSNLIFGLQHSAVSLALYDGEQICFGIVYDPFKDELFHAIRGEGSFLNGERIHVQKAEGLSDCLFYYGTNPYVRESKKTFMHLIEEVTGRCIDIRRFGSVALDLAHIACGRGGGYIEQNMKPWDIGAGIILIEEAGGIITDFRGNRIDPTRNADTLCGVPGVYEEMLELVARYDVATM
ncbi:MAG: inositol monophosphatase [Lachnospiraceae bacterium]|nr:inositol monophosphatase [Lachnospiraceae bacterium]